jgi:hypothetical protein
LLVAEIVGRHAELASVGAFVDSAHDLPALSGVGC